MIVLRKSPARRADHGSCFSRWHSFDARLAESSQHGAGFFALTRLDELKVGPRHQLPLRDDGADEERVTYVLAGGLTSRPAPRQVGVLRAGEFQRLARGVVQQPLRNASAVEWVHCFELGFRARPALHQTRQQLRFSMAGRWGAFCLIASPQRSPTTLQLDEDVRLYSACLDSGQHVVHELATERAAWLQVVEGEISLGGVGLSSGDGVGISEQGSVSLIASTAAEVLLIDVHDEGHGR